LLAAGVLAPIAVDVASDTSHFKFNLDYISLLQFDPPEIVG